MVRLAKSAGTAFGQRASISRKLAVTIFTRFHVHHGFMADMIGRPDYWSAIGRPKGKGGNPRDSFGNYVPRIMNVLESLSGKMGPDADKWLFTIKILQCGS